jgi:Putative metallopeptidase
MSARKRRFSLLCALGAAGLALGAPAGADFQSNRIRIEYVLPKNPEHQPIYDMLKQKQALEKLQEIFGAFRLPTELTLRTAGCDGIPNAWYQQAAITVCYELLDHIRKTLPKDMDPSGVTPADAVAGQFFYAFAHEMGHAAFDLLDVPNLGPLEDAADRFATFIILQFGPDDARKLIKGAAYAYVPYVQKPELSVPLLVFSDAHSPPPQRFFNLLCMAYGANSQLFADLVSDNYLPARRARQCQREYGEVAYAFKKLIGPHIDQEIAKRVMQRQWLSADKQGSK